MKTTKVNWKDERLKDENNKKRMEPSDKVLKIN